ncbi:hypothetical protein B6U90_07190 [Thermoplasmatales archaeon ex4484_6]|nr:MAG: hypothetical protein B6U90_07190 [Thermoplasmatales archaeon ex4484_6]RLF68460.1 MAG: hypothetical protein DRN57_03985 [Thermoplasmata archaeon]
MSISYLHERNTKGFPWTDVFPSDREGEGSTRPYDPKNRFPTPVLSLNKDGVFIWELSRSSITY